MNTSFIQVSYPPRFQVRLKHRRVSSKSLNTNWTRNQLVENCLINTVLSISFLNSALYSIFDVFVIRLLFDYSDFHSFGPRSPAISTCIMYRRPWFGQTDSILTKFHALVRTALGGLHRNQPLIGAFCWECVMEITPTSHQLPIKRQKFIIFPN